MLFRFKISSNNYKKIKTLLKKKLHQQFPEFEIVEYYTPILSVTTPPSHTERIHLDIVYSIDLEDSNIAELYIDCVYLLCLSKVPILEASVFIYIPTTEEYNGPPEIMYVLNFTNTMAKIAETAGLKDTHDNDFKFLCNPTSEFIEWNFVNHENVNS